MDKKRTVATFRKDITFQEIVNAGFLTHSPLKIDLLIFLYKAIMENRKIDLLDDWNSLWPESFFEKE